MRLANGFLEFDPIHKRPSATGALSGTRFAAKDVIDVAGSITGLGHPLWRQIHAPAQCNAACINKLLGAGAELIGKTHTDEFAYSLAGQNAHYGTPPNPAVPRATPGGSSSGSASVVAAGLVDFALGTDTGGSVRVPASFCGLYGLRPTHGLVTNAGVARLAESFDSVGWFASRPEVLLAVGRVLLPAPSRRPLRRVRMLIEGMRGADVEIGNQAKALIDTNALTLRNAEAVSVGPLDAFSRVFRLLQGYEAWACFGPWIAEHSPAFGPGVGERFAAAAEVSEETARAARTERKRLRHQVLGLLESDTVLCMPTTPRSATPLDATHAQVDTVRARTLAMTSIAGICGLPQVSLPLLHDGNGPVGMSLIGAPGSDLQLLQLAVQIRSAALQPPIE